jgi:hypothetical protein
MDKQSLNEKRRLGVNLLLEKRLYSLEPTEESVVMLGNQLQVPTLAGKTRSGLGNHPRKIARLHDHDIVDESEATQHLVEIGAIGTGVNENARSNEPETFPLQFSAQLRSNSGGNVDFA